MRARGGRGKTHLEMVGLGQKETRWFCLGRRFQVALQAAGHSLGGWLQATVAVTDGQSSQPVRGTVTFAHPSLGRFSI